MRWGSSSQIGIDIGTARLRLLRLQGSVRAGWQIVAAAQMPLPAPLLDGEPMSAAVGLGAALRQLAQQAGCRGGEAAVAALGLDVARLGWCELPPVVSTQACAALARREVERGWAPPPAPWRLDFCVQDALSGPRRMLYAAAHVDSVAAVATAVQLAGLQLVALEVEPLAWARALAGPPPVPAEVRAVLDLGADGLRLVWLHAGQAVGVENYAYGEPGAAGADPDALLAAVAAAFAVETTHAGRCRQLILVGGGALSAPLAASLAQRLGLSVVTGRLALPLDSRATAVIGMESAAWVLACGLACKRRHG